MGAGRGDRKRVAVSSTKLSKEEQREEWRDPDGELHRTGRPAVIIRYPNGKIKSEEYYQRGKWHRVGAPARIEYSLLGSPQRKEYIQHGKQHRENGPALIIKSKNGFLSEERYFRRGELHRVAGPAAISYYDLSKNVRSEIYSQNGDFHREDGPAVIRYRKDGSVDCEQHWLLGEEVELPISPVFEPARIDEQDLSSLSF